MINELWRGEKPDRGPVKEEIRDTRGASGLNTARGHVLSSFTAFFSLLYTGFNVALQ